MNNEEPEQIIHLSEYYYVLRKHKWTIISSFILIVTLTMFHTFWTKPIYRATVTLVIEKEQTKSPITGESLGYEAFISQAISLNTHLKLITSRPVLDQVIKNLRLDQLDREKTLEVNPLKKLLSQFKKNIRLSLGKKERILTPEERQITLTEKLKGKIDVEIIRETILLKVNAEDNDPVMAKDIANSLANAYIQFNISNRLKYSQKSLGWMSGRLYAMRKKLEDSEEEFLAFKQREKLFSLKGTQDLILQKRREFNDKYVEVRNRRLELEAKLNQLRKNIQARKDIPRIRYLISNKLVDDLYLQLLQSEVELSRLSKVYKQKHSKVIQIKTKIFNTRKKLNEEIKKEMESLISEQSVLLSREKVLQKTFSDFENEALDINRKNLKYTIFERNMKTNQNLYDTLLSKVKETDIIGNIDLTNIRISEEAVMPMSPVKPKKKLNLILSMIVGLMTGVGLSFLMEYLDRSLRTEEDVQRYLDQPVLCVIPKADAAKAHALSD
jgi:uncharacterized protein involved in exopolysaccharide biosynthesis